MKNFEIVGWNLTHCQAAAERMLDLLKLLSDENHKLCLEAHFKNIETVKQLSIKLTTTGFALYCWSKLDTSSFFDRFECRFIQSLRIICGPRSVLMAPDFDMPAYDGNDEPINFSRVTLIDVYQEPVSQGAKEPDHQIRLRIEAIAQAVAGAQYRFRTSTSMTGDTRRHSYMVFLPTGKAVALVREICNELEIRDGFGSFEFLSSAEDLERLIASDQYKVDGFPQDCWSWNDSVGKTAFAMGRESFRHPILNVETSQLAAIAPLIDSIGDGIAYCSVVRKYIAWKLVSGGFSPKTQGNYALLSKQKKGYALLIGFEQYADRDPSLKEFKAAAMPALAALGARMKPVSYIK